MVQGMYPFKQSLPGNVTVLQMVESMVQGMYPLKQSLPGNVTALQMVDSSMYAPLNSPCLAM